MQENYPQDDRPAGASPFWPLLVVILTVLVVVGWQFTIVRQQRAMLATEVVQRERVVQQARNVEAGLQRLIADLSGLAGTDNDARAILEKHQVSPSSSAALPAAKSR